jgi:hypothetical protein
VGLSEQELEIGKLLHYISVTERSEILKDSHNVDNYDFHKLI